MYGMYLFQMIYICGEGGAIPTKPSQMTDYFRKYLEIYSVAQSGLVVIVIDNAEMIQVSDLHNYYHKISLSII